jgi:RNA polymerase sigma-70 factor (ECF subfamily)
MTSSPEQNPEAAAVRAGDATAFEALSRRYYRELHLHCYRMLGSFDEAEELVQETFLRAWRHRETYAGRAAPRTWLYRIATNACLDRLAVRTRSEPSVEARVPRYEQYPWMQPYPDVLLEELQGRSDDAPDTLLISRETIELAFLATLQALPSKQRAAFVLRDVLDFSAQETADMLEDSVAAVNSALQRGRATLRERRSDNEAPVSAATFDEALFLQAYVDASMRGDIDAIVALFREDIRMTLLPACHTCEGAAAVKAEFLRRRADARNVRLVPVAANRQPALAVYLQRNTETAYRAWAISVLAVRNGQIVEIATFETPELFEKFRLPAIVNEGDELTTTTT